MHATILATIFAMIFALSRTAVWMLAAAIVLFLIAALAVRSAVAQAGGLDKIVALSNLCFAIPLAVFGAEHFAEAKGIAEGVPAFMPWHLFWAYFVGVALLAASLSIATRIQVQWSGLLFGIMMFLFVAMMDLPGTLAKPHDRFNWALLLRELSFGSGGWCLAAAAIMGSRPSAMQRQRSGTRWLVIVARVIIGVTAVFYGVEHFLHPINVPGVPLEKLMPTWIPARMLISYVTGALLVVAGAGILLAQRTRMAATYLGFWLVLVVLFIYGPILIASLLDASAGTQIEGINYFFDTLLYAGTILAVAQASPRPE